MKKVSFVYVYTYILFDKYVIIIIHHDKNIKYLYFPKSSVEPLPNPCLLINRQCNQITAFSKKIKKIYIF